MKKYFTIVLFFWGLTCFGNDTIKKMLTLSNNKFNSGDYVGAMNETMQALKMAEQNKDCFWTSFGYLQLGGLNYYLKKKDIALQNFHIARRYADSCKLEKFDYRIYHDIGVIYVDSKIADSALKYMNYTVNKLKGSKKYSYLSNTYCVLAVLYIGKKDLNTAEKYINEAEKMASLSKKEGDMMFVEMKKGSFYDVKGDLNNSLIHFKKAYAYASKSNVVEEKLYSLGSIANLLGRMGNKESVKYYALYGTLKDSVFNAETAGKLAGYKVKYETEKKEHENKLLQQQNELQQLKLETRNKTIIGLVTILILVVLIISWRINVINLKKKHKELEAAQKLQQEKERISRDLHDNVGGQLSYVLYSLEGKNGDEFAKQPELISNIQSTVKNVIGNLRETIWAINDETIQLDDFSDKLKVYTKNIFRYTNTKVTFTENIALNTQINSVTGLNLFRICQEIIHNAFKHSNAKNLIIGIESNENIKISISDDGIGFNPVKTGGSGFGLSNIEHRVNEINAVMELDSQSGRGTSYRIVV